MDKLRVIYTYKRNPISWLIRWAVPRSRFTLAQASHCIIADGEYVIEAHMLYGVRRVLAKEALEGLHVVKQVDYLVENAEAGLSWARRQEGAKYDWKGAFGLALSSNRNWQEPDKWFCFELAAATLFNAGLNVFSDLGHITGEHLLMLNPNGQLRKE